jgi:hypothetical protein
MYKDKVFSFPSIKLVIDGLLEQNIIPRNEYLMALQSLKKDGNVMS